MDISKCFSGSLQFRVNLQIILSKEIKEYILKFEMILSVTTIIDKRIKKLPITCHAQTIGVRVVKTYKAHKYSFITTAGILIHELFE